MANLNFPQATPVGTTKLVGFDAATPGGEKTYLAKDLPVSDATAAAIAAAVGGVFSQRTSSNSMGDITVTFSAGKRLHVEEVVFSGAPRTTDIVASNSDRESGDLLILRLVNDSVTGVVQDVYSTDDEGDSIYSLASDDGTAVLVLFFTGSVWKKLFNVQPIQ